MGRSIGAAKTCEDNGARTLPGAPRSCSRKRVRYGQLAGGGDRCWRHGWVVARLADPRRRQFFGMQLADEGNRSGGGLEPCQENGAAGALNLNPQGD